VASDIARQFPGRQWKPTELLDTLDAYVKETEAFNPAQRIYMQALIAGQRAQTQVLTQQMRDAQSGENTQAHVGVTERGQDLTHEDRVSQIAERWKAVQLQTTTQAKIAAARDATTLQATELRSASQQEIADKMIEFRTQALQAGLDEKTWQAQLAAALKEQGMSDAFISKLFTAQTSNAPVGSAPPAPARPATPLPAPPRRGAGVQVPGPGRSQGGPPVAGARQAPDGKWYVPDPQRPGKYLMVQ
jgi:hypothetical protein